MTLNPFARRRQLWTLRDQLAQQLAAVDRELDALHRLIAEESALGKLGDEIAAQRRLLQGGVRGL